MHRCPRAPASASQPRFGLPAPLTQFLRRPPPPRLYSLFPFRSLQRRLQSDEEVDESLQGLADRLPPRHFVFVELQASPFGEMFPVTRFSS